MDTQAVRENILAILKKYSKNEKAWAQADENSRIIEDLRINSARMIDIVADLERQFNVRIEDEVADRMDTLGSMVRIISEKTHG